MSESELQFVVRTVGAKLIYNHGLRFAEQLEAGDPNALESIRPWIQQAEKDWAIRERCIKANANDFYWCVKTTAEHVGNDGLVFKLTWGWNDDIHVKMTGADAWDLAREIIILMPEDPYGNAIRPEVPRRESGLDDTPGFHEFMEMSGELMKILGSGSCSMQDVSAWAYSGKPMPPLAHQWIDEPEDDLKVCSVCGAYYYTSDGTFFTQVCAGSNIADPGDPNITNFDPRRSVYLREAQRRDKLERAMRHYKASAHELEPIATAHLQAVALLIDPDLARYHKERVGLSAASSEQETA